ncbi:MAG: aminotransferase class I/II-fold pyridoxal phosphate-dependent enzyme [Flavobacterium sp.]|jgi:8-amino-7-oxononanoate synthase
MQFPYQLEAKINQRIENNSLRKLYFTNDLIDFSSNDYLGFSRNETIFNQTNQFLEDNHFNQNGATGSRLISGNYQWYQDVEQEIANFHKVEKALIYANGYAANLGLISAIAQKDCVILYDQYCHASIIDGIRLGFSKYFKFPHLDYNYLENLLQKNQSQTVFVLTESLFSMDGTIPDLKNISELCNQYNAYLIVDEAHAIGVLGKNGEGLIQELNLENQIFARIVTFGKAMGCHGAAILGSVKLIEYLINFSRSFIYSTALPPHAMATIQMAYQYLKKHHELPEKLRQKIAFFGENFKYFLPNSPIQTLILGNTDKTKKAAQLLIENKFDVKAILSPTVEKGKERLRICIHEYNTKEEINQLTQYLNQWKIESFL